MKKRFNAREIYRLVCSKSHQCVLNSVGFWKMFAFWYQELNGNGNTIRYIPIFFEFVLTLTNRRVYKTFRNVWIDESFAIDSHKIQQLHNFSGRNKSDRGITLTATASPPATVAIASWPYTKISTVCRYILFELLWNGRTGSYSYTLNVWEYEVKN